jgi:hypothetical protein
MDDDGLPRLHASGVVQQQPRGGTLHDERESGHIIHRVVKVERPTLVRDGTLRVPTSPPGACHASRGARSRGTPHTAHRE